jgi:hypothetical protein
MRKKGGAWVTLSGAYTVTSATPNLVTFHNRESSGGTNHVIELDNLRIEQGVGAPPLAQFQFEENATTTSDWSIPGGWSADGGTYGVLGASATFSPGLFGQGIAVDGTSTGRVTFPAGLFGRGTSDLTTSFWFKAPSSSIAIRELLGNRVSSSHGNFLGFRLGMSNITAEIDQDGSGTNYGFVTGGSNVSDNMWHHVAVTRAGTSLKLYLDGVLVSGASTAATTNLTLVNPVIYGQGVGSGTMGAIDELRVYPRELNACQVQVLSTHP